LLGNSTGYPNPRNERYPKFFNKHVFHAGFHCGAHAYSITLQTAQKLLNSNTPVTRCADQLFLEMYEQSELKCYVSVPIIFREDQSMPSSIVQ
jgi:hypothetical protein